MSEDRDLTYLSRGRWHLLRNIAEPGEPEDWCNWYVSVPDAGQGQEAALAELLEQARKARVGTTSS